MPTVTFQKRQMEAGESRESQPVTVPQGLAEVIATLDMSTTEMRDPTTDVRGILEFFDPATQVWRHVASVQMTGHPDNSVETQPYIQIGPATLSQLAGKQLRGRIEAMSSGRYGATISWQ